MKIKAILFDMDGVLIDAKDWHYEALNKALDLFGYTIQRYEHLTSFDGLPTSVKLEKLSVEKGLPRSLHKFINEMKQRYTMTEIHNKCHPVFIHEYALSRLKSEGYKIAVCSNSIRKTIETMMDYANLTQYLDEIFSNEDVVKSKPDPEIYITAMKRFGLKPEECLICEDNENGIKAAELSGGNLLKIKTTADVNYSNIHNRIKMLEDGE
ncbi:HAD family phosphatase [Treponema socranskii]|uniref:HAD family hydrolase n=1 Tax=Treponema socranskii TaxID=53419 RepID=UPI003D913A32